MRCQLIQGRRGRGHLARVEDLYSCKIVGRSTSDRVDSELVDSELVDSELVDSAIGMAIQHERFLPGLFAHSDRGVQYASDHLRQRLVEFGIGCSMSGKANCWGNARHRIADRHDQEKTDSSGDPHPTRDAARQPLF